MHILILLLALLFGLPSTGQATMALAQACVTTSPADTNPYTINLGSAATAGNLITVQAIHEQDSRSITGIDDAGTTVFAVGPNAVTDGAAGRVETWRGIAAGVSAGTTVVVTFSGGPASVTFNICEWTEAAADQSGATGNAGGATGASSMTHDSGSVTPPTANNVVLSAIRHTTGSYTYDSGFTQIAAGSVYQFGYIAQSAATAQEFNTTSVDVEFSTIQIAAFAGTSAASGPPLGSRSLLGVGR